MQHSSRRSAVLTVLVLGLLSAQFVRVPNASAIGGGDWYKRPSRWAPTQVFSQMAQNAPWGNVAYWMNWGGPASTFSLDEPRNDKGTFELGWKNTGRATCDQAVDGTFGKAGFPPEVNVQVDGYEDFADAVLWVADLDILGADQRANPTKMYSAWWRCQENGAFNSNFPVFQVEIGHWVFPEDPVSTFADAVLHYIPQEQGWHGLPVPGETRIIETQMFAPWTRDAPLTRDWNFETTDEYWYTLGAVKSRFCGPTPPDQGSCYEFLRPTLPGASVSWLGQTFQVESYYKPVGPDPWSQFELGNNTGFQVDIAFRCPTWSPAWAGKPTTTCRVAVWLKTAIGNWEGHLATIPADGKWYALIDDGYGAQPSDNDLNIYINSYGYPIDIDSVWVSSDL